VTKVLQPLWTKKPETARRVRGRIEAILDWAKACGYRDGENPVRFRGHLKHLLADIPEVRRVKHHAALPYAEIAEFIADIRERPGIAAKALEFTILTAARTGEVIGAQWDEINLKARVWTVPADRMKGSREHRVPLTDAAIAVLEQMREVRQNEFIFPGDRRAMMSNMAMDCSCGEWAETLRSTVSAARLKTGQARGRISRTRLAKLRSRMLWGTRSRPPIGVVTCLRSVAGLWKRGLNLLARDRPQARLFRSDVTAHKPSPSRCKTTTTGG
jgi:integrase